MNKKLTKLLSIFLIAGLIGTGTAVGLTGCKNKNNGDNNTNQGSGDNTNPGDNPNPENPNPENPNPENPNPENPNPENPTPEEDPLKSYYGSYYEVSYNGTAISVAAEAAVVIAEKSIKVGDDECAYEIKTGYVEVTLGSNKAYVTVEGGLIKLWNDLDEMEDEEYPDAVYVNKTKAEVDADSALKEEILKCFPSIYAVTIDGVTTCEGGEKVVIEVTVIGDASDLTYSANITSGGEVATMKKVEGEDNKYEITTSEVTENKTVKVTVTSNYGGVSEEYTLTVTKIIQTPYKVLSAQQDKVFAKDFSTDVAAADIPVYAGLGKTMGAIYQHGNDNPADAHAPIAITGGKLVIGDSAGGGIARAYVDFGKDYQEIELTAVIKAAGAQNSKPLFAIADIDGNLVFEIGTGDNFTFHLGGTADNSKPDYAVADTTALANIPKADVVTVYIKIDIVTGKLTLKMKEGEKVEATDLITVYNEKEINIASIAGLRISSHNSGKNTVVIDNLAVCGVEMAADRIIANNNAKIAAYETKYDLEKWDGYTELKTPYTTKTTAQDVTVAQANEAYATWYKGVLAGMKAAIKDKIDDMFGTGFTVDATKVETLVSALKGEIDAKTKLEDLETYFDEEYIGERAEEADIKPDVWHNAKIITLAIVDIEDGTTSVLKSGVTLTGKAGWDTISYSSIYTAIAIPNDKAIGGIFTNEEGTFALQSTGYECPEAEQDETKTIYVQFGNVVVDESEYSWEKLYAAAVERSKPDGVVNSETDKTKPEKWDLKADVDAINADFTDDNEFLSLNKGGTVKIRAPKNSVLEIKNDALVVNFKGTGTLSVRIGSTSGSNKSSIALKNKSTGAYVTGSIVTDAEKTSKMEANAENNAFVVTGIDNVDAVTFNVVEPGEYVICTLGSVTIKESSVGTGRNTRVYAISMVDNYAVAGIIEYDVEEGITEEGKYKVSLADPYDCGEISATLNFKGAPGTGTKYKVNCAADVDATVDSSSVDLEDYTFWVKPNGSVLMNLEANEEMEILVVVEEVEFTAGAQETPMYPNLPEEDSGDIPTVEDELTATATVGDKIYYVLAVPSADYNKLTLTLTGCTAEIVNVESVESYGWMVYKPKATADAVTSGTPITLGDTGGAELSDAVMVTVIVTATAADVKVEYEFTAPAGTAANPEEIESLGTTAHEGTLAEGQKYYYTYDATAAGKIAAKITAGEGVTVDVKKLEAGVHELTGADVENWESIDAGTLAISDVENGETYLIIVEGTGAYSLVVKEYEATDAPEAGDKIYAPVEVTPSFTQVQIIGEVVDPEYDPEDPAHDSHYIDGEVNINAYELTGGKKYYSFTAAADAEFGGVFVDEDGNIIEAGMIYTYDEDGEYTTEFAAGDTVLVVVTVDPEKVSDINKVYLTCELKTTPPAPSLTSVTLTMGAAATDYYLSVSNNTIASVTSTGVKLNASKGTLTIDTKNYTNAWELDGGTSISSGRITKRYLELEVAAAGYYDVIVYANDNGGKHVALDCETGWSAALLYSGTATSAGTNVNAYLFRCIEIDESDLKLRVGGDGTLYIFGVTITPTEPVAATAISLNKTSTTLELGGQETLTATLTPANSTDRVTWSSDNTDIATVDANGKITAMGQGTCTITATARDGVTATCEITVTAPTAVAAGTYVISYNNSTGAQEITQTIDSVAQATPTGLTSICTATTEKNGVKFSGSDEAITITLYGLSANQTVDLSVQTKGGSSNNATGTKATLTNASATATMGTVEGKVITGADDQSYSAFADSLVAVLTADADGNVVIELKRSTGKTEKLQTITIVVNPVS